MHGAGKQRERSADGDGDVLNPIVRNGFVNNESVEIEAIELAVRKDNYARIPGN